MVLPGASLFPHALLPLYIFEPGYREMLTWSLEHDRMFCIAPLKDGVAEAQTADDFHHTVGLGLVRACVQREDGTSHLMLQGFARVQLTGFAQETPFRIAELRELRSTPAEPLHNELLVIKLRAVLVKVRESGVRVPASLEGQLAQIGDAGILGDIVAHSFLRESRHRQDVFEELRAGERLRLLIRHLTAEML